LSKKLRKLDHIRVVLERLGKVDHIVGCVLLLTWSWRSKECTECRDRHWIALKASTSFVLQNDALRTDHLNSSKRWTYACNFPFRGRVYDHLRDSLGEGCSVDGGRGQSDSKDSR